MESQDLQGLRQGVGLPLCPLGRMALRRPGQCCCLARMLCGRTERAAASRLKGPGKLHCLRIVHMRAIELDSNPVLRPAIMLVDDAEPYMNIMSSVLRGCGLEVHLARGAPEALQMLDQVTPDLILLDVMMPEVDGISFLSQLRSDARLQVVPVVVVTAYPDTRQEAIQAGANGFLAKPFTTQQLRRMIGEFLQVRPTGR